MDTLIHGDDSLEVTVQKLYAYLREIRDVLDLKEGQSILKEIKALKRG